MPWVRFLAAIAAIVVIGYTAHSIVDEHHVRETLNRVVADYSGPGFVVAAAILCVVFVPTPLLAAIGGALFGAVVGSVLSAIAATLAATAMVLPLRRRLFRGLAVRRGPVADRVQIAFAGSTGWKAVVALRLAPGIPFAASSYALGLTSVAYRHVAIGTVVGVFPRSAIYATFGSAVSSLNGGRLVLAVGLLVLVGACGLVLLRSLWLRGLSDA